MAKSKNTNAADENVVITTKEESGKKGDSKSRIVVKEVDPTDYVTVKNGFQGALVYISRRNGEELIWDYFGDEQEMELRELKNAKNSHKKYFTNNWFMFDDDDIGWITEYLGVGKYYKNALSIDNFDEVFEMSASDVKKRISKLSSGQKRSVAYRARVLISEGKIDSMSVIKALEESLGVDLIER